MQAVHSNTDAGAYNIIAVQLARANTGADKYSSSNNSNTASDNADTSPHTEANIAANLVANSGRNFNAHAGANPCTISHTNFHAGLCGHG